MHKKEEAQPVKKEEAQASQEIISTDTLRRLFKEKNTKENRPSLHLED